MYCALQLIYVSNDVRVEADHEPQGSKHHRSSEGKEISLGNYIRYDWIYLFEIYIWMIGCIYLIF